MMRSAMASLPPVICAFGERLELLVGEELLTQTKANAPESRNTTMRLRLTLTEQRLRFSILEAGAMGVLKIRGFKEVECVLCV